MFRRYCASCFARHQGVDLLCFPCLDELHDLKLSGGDAIISCYRYRGVIRRLVLRAKVQGDHRAVGLLSDLVLGNATVDAWARGVDFLMPSPSSLWGRARGRLDLAAILTADIGKKYGLVVKDAPNELHWRIRKRALTKRSDREPLVAATASFSGDDGGPTVGLFDDVVTTGQTLAWTRSALPAEAHVRPLTLASARE